MITVSINTEHLFSLVNQRSLYIANQLDPQLNELMIDVIPITEDERDFFKIALRDAAVRLASVISPISKDASTPFILDEENGLLHYTVDETRHSQPQLLESIMPALIMRGCVVWILSDWLRIKGLHRDFYQTELAEWEEVKGELKKKKKKKTSRLKMTYY